MSDEENIRKFYDFYLENLDKFPERGIYPKENFIFRISELYFKDVNWALFFKDFDTKLPIIKLNNLKSFFSALDQINEKNRNSPKINRNQVAQLDEIVTPPTYEQRRETESKNNLSQQPKVNLNTNLDLQLSIRSEKIGNKDSSNSQLSPSKTIPKISNPTSQNTPSVSVPKPQEQTNQTHPNTISITPTQLPSATPASKSESSQKPQQSLPNQPLSKGLTESDKTHGNKSSESQIPPQSKQGIGSTVPPKVDSNANLINMPNGIENQSYEYKFPKQPGKKYTHSENSEFNSVGLEISGDTNFFYIKGDKLKNPGNHLFEINEVLLGKKTILKLFINKDPKSLWNVLEPVPKEKAIFDKTHYQAELEETQLFKIVGASLRGRSHAHEGKFREDDFKIHIEPDGIIVVAVSDGAGSAKYSRIGSYHVCDEGVKQVVKHFNDKRSELEPLLEAYAEGKLRDPEKQKLSSIPQFLIESGLHVNKYLNEVLPAQYQAKHPDLKFQSRDFSATFLIGILIPMKGKYILCTFWAGDGGIGYLHKETNKVECLGIPDGGEFSGQTLFVNSSSVFTNNEYLYSTRVQFRLLNDFTTILLMSDGVTDPKFGTDSELKNPEKWNLLWSEIEPHIYSTNPKENLQEWLGFWSQGNYDDRTFISISKKR